MKKSVAGKKSKAAPKAANGYKLAERMPEGFVLTDLLKRQWKLGKPVGNGGFGLIYLAESCPVSTVGDNASYVMKIEPAANGPLFCEQTFYQRVAKPDQIKEWITSRKLKTLGVPHYVAAGLHETAKDKYRFLVMQRFGTDVQKLFEENGKRLPTHTVFSLGLKLLDVLEYIHCNEYAHADIKASNIMTSYTDPNQVHLVDYGLAYRYMVEGVHKEYKEDPRKAHDGTIEFASRDAHRGVWPSRRGDLEIVGYCMLQWLCGSLPWENNLENKDYVRDQKIRYMKNIPDLIDTCAPDCPREMASYLKFVANLKYDEEPNYQKCRDLFRSALTSLGHKETDQLTFTTQAARPKVTKAGQKRAASPVKHVSDDESPPKARKTAGKPKKVASAMFSDEENQNENNRSKALDGKRVWPKAKKSPGKAAVKVKSPLAIAKEKKLKLLNGSPVKGPVEVQSESPLKLAAKAAVKHSPKATKAKPVLSSSSPDFSPLARPALAGYSKVRDSPLAIAKAKVTASNSAKATKVLTKRKKVASQSTIATQTSPGLIGLARTQDKKKIKSS